MHTLLRLTVIAAVLSFVPVSPAVPITGTYTTGGNTSGTGPWTMLGLGVGGGAALSFTLNSPIAFQNLTDLNYGYDSILGGISDGSPRVIFFLDYNNDTFEDVYFGLRWGPFDPTIGDNLNTGNLLGLNDMGRYDLTGLGLPAVFEFSDRTTALAAVGTVEVLRIALVIEGIGDSTPRVFKINSVNVSGNATAIPGNPTAIPEAGSTLAWLGFAVAAIMGIRRFTGPPRSVPTAYIRRA